MRRPGARGGGYTARMARLLLFVTALAFAVFGVLFIVSPERMAGTVTLVVATPMARTEVLAMYGGLELGIAAFLAHCAYHPAYTTPGLLAAGLMLTGLGTLRLIGVVTGEGTQPLMWELLVFELVGGVLALVFWWRASRRPALGGR